MNAGDKHAYFQPAQACGHSKNLGKSQVENWEASILSSILWMLEDLEKSEEDLLDVPSYAEPLGEGIFFFLDALST